MIFPKVSEETLQNIETILRSRVFWLITYPIVSTIIAWLIFIRIFYILVFAIIFTYIQPLMHVQAGFAVLLTPTLSLLGMPAYVISTNILILSISTIICFLLFVAYIREIPRKWLIRISLGILLFTALMISQCQNTLTTMPGF